MIGRAIKSPMLNAVCLAALVAVPGTASAETPESFVIGQNSEGDVCSAALQWTVGEGTLFADEQPFGITCRGVDAAELQGYISGAELPPVGNCGDSVELVVAGIGPVEARQCVDEILGRSAIDLRFNRGGRTWHGASIPVALPNLEAALKVVALDRAVPEQGEKLASSISVDAIPAGPESTALGALGGITLESTITEGVRALQAGRQLDASRILNDALREFANADSATLVDLRLAAGLADSNNSRFDAAEQHFAAAELLLELQGAEADSQQMQQLLVYRGLHLINQREWDRAIAALTRVTPANAQLLDPTVLSRLNQETLTFGGGVGTGDLQSSLGDEAALQSVLLEAQRFWTLSVAELARGDRGLDAAETAIQQAAEIAASPIARIEAERIGWLHAAIERQQGRIYARRNDIGAALDSFDCAIGALQGRTPSNSGACLVRPMSRPTNTGAISAILLETQLERASIASRDPARHARALEDYRSAVSGLGNLDGVGPVSQAALERYFDLMVGARTDSSRDEEFFRAMQAIGEPGIAREYAVMQQRVAADAGIAELLRQRRDLQQTRNGLSFEIAELAGSDASLRAEREAELAETVRALDALNAQIDQTGGLAQLSDNPATLGELSASLAPGEVYLKIVQLSNAMFGMVISPQGSEAFRIPGSLSEVEALAEGVLGTAQSNNGRVRRFDVEGAHELFNRITGPASATVAGASRVIFDPAGVFRRMPVGILVTNSQSVETYLGSGRAGDYGPIDFLAERTETAVSLSPRAFLVSRTDLRQSAATNDIIGFADAPAPALSPAQAATRMPFECSVTLGQWASALYSADPVSALELQRIAQALGMARIPQVVGQQFTDAALTGSPLEANLSDYKILHFATHGIPGRQINLGGEGSECLTYVPPSLVTALATPAPGSIVASDGLLSFEEVTGLPLDANLVVLSACDTSAGASTLAGRAAGFETSDAALDGLVRSFLVAQARAVMATFWRVPDNEATIGFMSTFYQAGRDQSIAASLQAARLSVIQNPRYSHPYYWGNFFLVGDGAKMMYGSSPQVAMN